ncbi:MAG: transposase [Bryobacteraceae bacterium]
MTFYRRRLPHWHPEGHPLFLTWRLHGSLPAHRYFPGGNVTSGQAFAAMDRLLDSARAGPLYLSQAPIAQIVVDSLQYAVERLEHFALHSYVVMPNHVHLLVTPAVDVPKLTRSLKGITAKRANQQLGLTGQPFWQEESYDHWIRSGDEFARVQAYIEGNPVSAGFVRTPEEYLWSSAARAGRGAGRGPGGPPHPPRPD